MSTMVAGSVEVGVLRDFGGNDLVSIRPLQRAFDSLPVAGTYTVESSTHADYDQFLRLFAQRIAANAGATPSPWSVTDFAASTEQFPSIAAFNPNILNAIQYLIISIVALLLVYWLLYEAKRAGIMKLHGFGTFRVWYYLSGQIILFALLASVVLSLLATLFVPNATADFSISVVEALVRAFIAMLAASLLTSAYIARIRLSDSVKNRKDTSGIFTLNTTLRTVGSVALIVIGAGLWLQYSNVAAERAKLGDWERTKGYGIFYPVSVGNDLIEAQTGQAGPTAAEVDGLYPLLNEEGALYVDATSYEPSALSQALPTGAFRSMQVNPNFLRIYPLRDESGARITVSESTQDWIVLAPANLKARSNEILAFFRDSRHGAVQGERAVFGRPAAASFKDQRVRIIWMADRQQVFSFNPSVNPSGQNKIPDPIVQVMTTSNSFGVDRANSITGGPGTALKVHFVSAGPTATAGVLLPTLENLKLDDNLRHLVSMNEYVVSQVQTLQDGVRNVAITAAGLAVGMAVLIVEGLAILFARYSRKIVVRRLFGLTFRKRYREFLLFFVVLWIVQTAVALAANRAGLSPFSTPTFTSIAGDGTVLAVTGVVLLIELTFSATVLIYIEKRNIVKVLKGEF
jgi:bacteriocin-associated integral membrane protein